MCSKEAPARVKDGNGSRVPLVIEKYWKIARLGTCYSEEFALNRVSMGRERSKPSDPVGGLFLLACSRCTQQHNIGSSVVRNFFCAFSHT